MSYECFSHRIPFTAGDPPSEVNHLAMNQLISAEERIQRTSELKEIEIEPRRLPRQLQSRKLSISRLPEPSIGLKTLSNNSETERSQRCESSFASSNVLTPKETMLMGRSTVAILNTPVRSISLKSANGSRNGGVAQLGEAFAEERPSRTGGTVPNQMGVRFRMPAEFPPGPLPSVANECVAVGGIKRGIF
ncbi:hypothetical protein BD779DRAFT_1474698 [Infundibulicybe gibba]|nr:hypothetical protein BD779DRAFT_1474698 [Infundibulicybe gibba]